MKAGVRGRLGARLDLTRPAVTLPGRVHDGRRAPAGSARPQDQLAALPRWLADAPARQQPARSAGLNSFLGHFGTQGRP